MGELRRLACLGVPDGGNDVRPLVWKVPTRLLFCCRFHFISAYGCLKLFFVAILEVGIE
jgi:hypothetical protein